MARDLNQPLMRALLVLTFTTGLVDAVCYLGLGRVFAANMTGNIVLLGFGVAGGAHLPVVAPLISLGAFLIGAFLIGAGLGGGAWSRLADPYPGFVARALAVETVLITAAVVVAVAVDVRPDHLSGDVVIGLLALAMGFRNATVRRLAVPDMTTTVVTLTLTGLAAESRLFGGEGKGTSRRVVVVSSMFLGAVAGALLLQVTLAAPLIAAALLALATWLVFVPAAREAE